MGKAMASLYTSRHGGQSSGREPPARREVDQRRAPGAPRGEAREAPRRSRTAIRSLARRAGVAGDDFPSEGLARGFFAADDDQVHSDLDGKRLAVDGDRRLAVEVPA